MAHMTYSIETFPDLHARCVAQAHTQNHLSGMVIGRCHEQDMRYRVRISDGGLIDIVPKPQSDRLCPIDLGQHLTLDIAPGNVRLDHPDAMDSRAVNTWPGRIVLAGRRDNAPLVIVKILGHQWTLESTQDGFQLGRLLRSWDYVAVHIPPDVPRIVHRFPGHARLYPRLLTQVAE